MIHKLELLDLAKVMPIKLPWYVTHLYFPLSTAVANSGTVRTAFKGGNL